MEEKNNESGNSYTGEYGNSVEGSTPSNSSTYSYSYKEGDNSVTHSGDYYAERDNAKSSTTGAENESSQNINMQNFNSQNMGTQNTGFQSDGNNINFNSYANGYGSSYGDNRQKKNMGTGKKFLITAACAVAFGVIAGLCFETVCYVSDTVLGITSQNTKKIGTTTESDRTTTSKGESTTVNRGAVTDVSAIVEQTMPAIVAITSTSEGANYYDLFGQYYQGQDETSCGSGFIVGQSDSELLIATNNHVIDGAKTISVQFIDDEVYEAAVKGTASSNDLAVIAVKLKSIKSSTMDEIKIADLGDSDALKVGEMAIAIGNSLGYGQSVTVGYISAKDREITESSDGNGVTNKIKAIQTDAAINPGNSGGALLNLQGQVIGINSAKIASSSVEGVGYAIPISEATPIIDELMNKEDLSEDEKGYLGISGRTVTDEASYYNIPNGVYVAEVAEGGAADKAGIKVGDIITEINNMEVTTIESLQEKVNSYRKGTEIEVVLQRSNNGTYEEKKLKASLQGNSSLDGLSSDSNSGNGSSGNNNSYNDNSGNYGFDDDGGVWSNPFSN